MPKIDYQFQSTPLKWVVLRGGARHTWRKNDTVDLDGGKGATGQAFSEIFTIEPMPEGAEDDKWDTIEFSFAYQHINLTPKSKLNDHGSVLAWIADENLKRVDPDGTHQQLLTRENSSLREVSGGFTATFYNLSPGNYRLFIGEKDKGDGEALRVQAYSGRVTEMVPDPAPPAVEEVVPTPNGETIPVAEDGVDRPAAPPTAGGEAAPVSEEGSSRVEGEPDQLGALPANGGEPGLLEERILSRGERDLDRFGEPPPTNEGETTPEGDEILSRDKRDLDQFGAPPATNDGEPGLLEGRILSRGERDLDRFGAPPPTNGGESWPLEPRILSRGERDLNRFGAPPPTNAGESAGSAPCFTGGTVIETWDGPMPVQDLQKGTLVQTCAGKWQPIRWIGARKFNARELKQYPQLRPIRIKTGALGNAIPFSDLTVSPQHRILVRSKPAQRMFGTNEILVAAKHLLEIDGVDTVWDEDEVEYYHFMFDRHEIVYANGAETESFYVGEQAIKTIGEAAFREISLIFPQLQEGNPMMPALPFATGRRARQLIRRHLKNQLELVSHNQMRLH